MADRGKRLKNAPDCTIIRLRESKKENIFDPAWEWICSYSHPASASITTTPTITCWRAQKEI